jgi:hypothetical protein
MSAYQARTALMIVSLFNNRGLGITLVCIEKVQIYDSSGWLQAAHLLNI